MSHSVIALANQQNSVNLLRAIAIIFVWAHHIQHYMGVVIPYLGWAGGILGVELFFMVSGYLMLQTASKRGAWAFWWNRIFRIFPAYWVALLFVSFWPSQINWSMAWRDWPYFLVNFLSLSHFFPYAMGRFDVLSVSWTLSIEWTFYLMVPFLIWLSGRDLLIKIKPFYYWLCLFLVSLIISFGWCRLAFAGLMDSWYLAGLEDLGIQEMTDGLRVAFIVSAAPAQWMFFFLGSVVWVAQESVRSIPTWMAFLLCISMLRWFNALPLLNNSWPYPIAACGLFFLFLISLRLSTSVVKSSLLRPLHKLGEWSYSIYLVHVPVIFVVQDHLMLKGYFALISVIVITLAISYSLYFLVENPCRKLGQKLQPAIIKSTTSTLP